MKITNRNNIPSTIADAMVSTQARYSKGDAWMSITGLQRPPRISLLSKRHWKDLSEDVSDGVWKLFGSAIHQILEDGKSRNSIIKEERFFTEVLGKTISGAVDVQEISDYGIEVSDYKVTRAISVMPNSFSLPSWTEQLNAYAELVERNKGIPVTRLFICAIIRDHSPREAERNPDYPQAPIHMLEIELWPQSKREDWLKERVAIHLNAETDESLMDVLPECTPEETWSRGAKWAVKASPNSVRAKKVFDSEDEAIAMASTNANWVVEHRPSQPLRCQKYCEVSKFCDQFKTWETENET